MEKRDLETLIAPNEKVLWKGRPNKKCFILESIFNPLLPFALIWGGIDLSVILLMMSGQGEWEGDIPLNGPLFFVFFFLIHLMPVWIYLLGVIFASLKQRNIQFMITDRGVYISGGLFSFTYEMKPFTMLSHVSLHQGVFDRLIKVGDVVFSTTDYPINMNSTRNTAPRFAIINIPDYEEVYKLVTKLQTDIYSDTMYPNDLRPNSNHGYKTNYSASDKDKSNVDSYTNNK